MTVRLDCGKVQPASGCTHVMEAESEDEVMRLAAEHAREDHGMEVTPELAQEVRKHLEYV